MVFSYSCKETAVIVVHPPALTTTTAGETVRLTCVAYGYPLPSITWTSGNLDLADKVTNENVSIREATFLVSAVQLYNLTSADTAEYACTATNQVSGSPVAENSVKFFLSVSQPVTGEDIIVLYLFHTCSMHVQLYIYQYNTNVEALGFRAGCSNVSVCHYKHA